MGHIVPKLLITTVFKPHKISSNNNNFNSAFIWVYLAFGRTNLERVIHFGAITPGLFRWKQFNENDRNIYEMTFCYLLEHKFYKCYSKAKKSTRWHRRREKEYTKDSFPFLLLSVYSSYSSNLIFWSSLKLPSACCALLLCATDSCGLHSRNTIDCTCMACQGAPKSFSL